MLERISIKNYAIIDNLEINFSQGLSAFTGETGAGKSILIEALSLLLGGRSDLSMIRSNNDSMTIEGEFTTTNPEIINFLKEHDIDNPENLIIRREIHRSGKNRVFINSNQETLSKLEEIGNRLADIHGQHDHQLLLNKKVHGDILDSFSKLNSMRENFADIYQKTLEKFEEKKLLEENAENLRKEKDYYLNAYKEISHLNLEVEEEKSLEEELSQIQNSEKIISSLNHAYQSIYASEINASLILEDAKKCLQSISTFSKKYEELTNIIDDALVKTRESAHLLSSYVEEIDFDTEDLDKTLDRIATIKELKRKYQKNSIEELNQFATNCHMLLNKAENLDIEMEKLSQEYELAVKNLGEKALELSKARQQGATEMSKKIEHELSFLGMTSARFEVKITYVKQEDSFLILNENPIQVSQKGIDRIEFMISANLGEEPKPLARTASGGEISRIMLSLKSALAQSDPIEIGVFDEIDSGIGGMTAHNVAIKMKEISEQRQIFCITHLAQIASKADQHYQVRKENDGNRTFTSIIKLSQEERIKEIARMLGGEGESSEQLAKEMLYQNNHIKK